jgi:hypothetical protein
VVSVPVSNEGTTMLTAWLRMKNPMPRYTVTWTYPGGPKLTYRGTFRKCDELIARLLDSGTAEDIAGYRPDGWEDTWLFPAACREAFAYPSRIPTGPGRARVGV